MLVYLNESVKFFPLHVTQRLKVKFQKVKSNSFFKIYLKYFHPPMK